jgi:hypothetical protein
LFFHTFPKLVQALVVTYDKIFQALAAKGDVLPVNPFLDLGFDGVVRWKSPASDFHVFGKQKEISEVSIRIQKKLTECGIKILYVEELR